MTPQEIFDYKNRWKPGHTVRLHSDLEDRGKEWCKRALEKHQWDMVKWTDVYEHTFCFEDIIAGQNFAMEMGYYANQKKDFDIESLDPDKRSWYYDGDGTKRKKE